MHQYISVFAIYNFYRMLKVELHMKMESSGAEESRAQTESDDPSKDLIEKNTEEGRGSKSKRCYECEKCGKKFQRYFRYKNHVSYMHEEDGHGKGKIQCSVCGKRYMEAERLNKHMLMHSNGKEKIQCSICGKRFIEANRLENHLEKHTCSNGKGKIYKCSVGAKQYSANEEFQKHIIAHKPMVTFNEKVYCCALCGEKFLRDYQLNRHRCHLLDFEQFAFKTGPRSRKWQSPKVHNNHCPICNKSYLSTEGWRKHMIIHRGQGNFKCSECSEQFTEKRELNIHMVRRHTGEKPFKCSLCNKTCISRSNLDSHEKVHSEVYYECCVCGKEFKNISLMKGHDCQSDEQFGMTDDKLILCSICRSSFDVRSTLIEHSSIHKDTHPYKCPWCSDRFSVKQDLTKHHRKTRPIHVSQSAKDYPYECKLCLKRFRKQSSLKTHKKVIHCRKKMKQTMAQSKPITLQNDGINIPLETVISPYTIKEEKIENDDMEAVQEHISASSGPLGNNRHQTPNEELVENGNKSNGERTLNDTDSVQYKCDVCRRKSFVVWGNYQRHMKHAHGRNVERDERLWCAICEEKFLSVESLENHVVIHNRSSLHYCCALCGEKFFRNHQLTSHRCSLLNSKILPKKIGTKQRSWDIGGGEITHCPICNKLLKSHSSWQNHMNLHLRHREFKCSFCSKQFIGRRELRIHMRHHTGVRPYKCKWCPKSFVSLSNVASHEKSHFAIHHACCMCGMEFIQENDLHAHKCESDNSVNSETVRVSLKSVCNVCRKSCASRSVLKRHMLVHADTHPHTCSRCYQGFKHEQDLGKHQRKERLKSECAQDYPFQCSICLNRFDSLRKLKLHEAHGHERTYSRPIKPYSVQDAFSTPPNGKVNGDAVGQPSSIQGENGRVSLGDQGHTITPMIPGVKDYQCLVCDKIFYTKNRLKGHLKIHTGIKPHGCSKCEKRFDNRSSLKRHKKCHKKKKKR